MADEELNASRRPNPQRVEHWRDTIRKLSREVTHVEWFRDEFARVEAIVRGNPKVLNAESYFPAHVNWWYFDSQAMRIRRLVDPFRSRL